MEVTATHELTITFEAKRGFDSEAVTELQINIAEALMSWAEKKQLCPEVMDGYTTKVDVY